jgi:hypothetical protein
MMVRKGSRVKYKVGRGYGLGRVKHVKGGVATIVTEHGVELNRSVEKLKSPDEDPEPATAAPAAEDPPGQAYPFDDGDDDGDDEFDTDLEPDDEE